MRWLTCAILLLSLRSAQAQCERSFGKAVELRSAGRSVSIGCDGSLFAIPPLKVARAENENLYRLIRNMRAAYREVLGTEQERKAFDREQKMWDKGLRKTCKAEKSKAKKPDADLCLEACRKWAGICLLEDLLTRYDAIAAPVEVQP
ncbi:MAG: hypothetical protein KF905_10245 [Flavobacteriales bacterium]|nr:hypothetical protein [Flavobacteriales bacterium]